MKRRHEPAPGQRALPFTRSEQLRLRRDVTLPALEKFLLWVLDDHIGAGRSWTLTLEQLAEETGLSVTSVRKHAAALVERGLVWFRKTTGHYHERNLEWFITWANVEELVQEQAATVREPVDSVPVTVAACSSTNPTDSEGFFREPQESFATRDNPTPREGIARNPQDSIYRKSAPLSAPLSAPPSTPNATEPADDFADRKIGVVVVVKECGVGQFVKAVDQALAAGMTLDQIRDVCGEFQAHPGRWTPAQLFERLTRSGASLLGASEGWFGDSPEWTAREARRKAAQEAQERKEAEEMPIAPDPTRDALEAAYGPTVDAMTMDEIAELLEGAKHRDFLLKMIRRCGRNAPAVRPELVNRVAVREAEKRAREQQLAAALAPVSETDQDEPEEFLPFHTEGVE